MPAYRSRTTTHGRNMAGARGLWRATGMKDGDFGKPIIAVVNSFTQFVPGHVHLKDLGQLVAREIEAAGGLTAVLTDGSSLVTDRLAASTAAGIDHRSTGQPSAALLAMPLPDGRAPTDACTHGWAVRSTPHAREHAPTDAPTTIHTNAMVWLVAAGAQRP